MAVPALSGMLWMVVTLPPGSITKIVPFPKSPPPAVSP